jgi:hypothetical protein
MRASEASDGELIYEAGGAVIPRWFAGAEKREVA